MSNPKPRRAADPGLVYGPITATVPRRAKEAQR